MADEKELERRREFARGQKVSLDFLKAKLLDPEPLAACAENAAVLSQYIQDHQLEWSVENLNAAFEALKPMGVLKFAIPEQAFVESEAVDETPAPAWPWGSTLTAEMLKSMSARDVKRFMQSSRVGDEFKRQVLDLRLSATSLGRF